MAGPPPPAPHSERPPGRPPPRPREAHCWAGKTRGNGVTAPGAVRGVGRGAPSRPPHRGFASAPSAAQGPPQGQNVKWEIPETHNSSRFTLCTVLSNTLESGGPSGSRPCARPAGDQAASRGLTAPAARAPSSLTMRPRVQGQSAGPSAGAAAQWEGPPARGTVNDCDSVTERIRHRGHSDLW